MNSFKKYAFLAGLAAMLVGGAATASIGDNIQWMGDKVTFRVGPVQSRKPSTNWDTQKTKDYNGKYKFVIHRPGANPVCWLRFDDNPSGKTAHKYASWLKARLKQRGLSGLSQRKQVIDGRNVSFVSGVDHNKNFRYLVGVWRNRDVGINLECTAHANDFSVYEPQFMSFISNTRIVSEGRY